MSKAVNLPSAMMPERRKFLIDQVTERRANRRIYDAETCTSLEQEIYELVRYGYKGIEQMTDTELEEAWAEEQAREREEDV